VLVLGTENGCRDAGPVAPDARGTGDHRVRSAQAKTGGTEGTGNHEVGIIEDCWFSCGCGGRVELGWVSCDGGSYHVIYYNNNTTAALPSLPSPPPPPPLPRNDSGGGGSGGVELLNFTARVNRPRNIILYVKYARV